MNGNNENIEQFKPKDEIPEEPNFDETPNYNGNYGRVLISKDDDSQKEKTSKKNTKQKEQNGNQNPDDNQGDIDNIENQKNTNQLDKEDDDYKYWKEDIKCEDGVKIHVLVYKNPAGAVKIVRKIEDTKFFKPGEYDSKRDSIMFKPNIENIKLYNNNLYSHNIYKNPNDDGALRNKRQVDPTKLKTNQGSEFADVGSDDETPAKKIPSIFVQSQPQRKMKSDLFSSKKFERGEPQFIVKDEPQVYRGRIVIDLSHAKKRNPNTIMKTRKEYTIEIGNTKKKPGRSTLTSKSKSKNHARDEINECKKTKNENPKYTTNTAIMNIDATSKKNKGNNKNDNKNMINSRIIRVIKEIHPERESGKNSLNKQNKKYKNYIYDPNNNEDKTKVDFFGDNYGENKVKNLSKNLENSQNYNDNININLGPSENINNDNKDQDNNNNNNIDYIDISSSVDYNKNINNRDTDKFKLAKPQLNICNEDTNKNITDNIDTNKNNNNNNNYINIGTDSAIRPNEVVNTQSSIIKPLENLTTMSIIDEVNKNKLDTINDINENNEDIGNNENNLNQNDKLNELNDMIQNKDNSPINVDVVPTEKDKDKESQNDFKSINKTKDPYKYLKYLRYHNKIKENLTPEEQEKLTKEAENNFLDWLKLRRAFKKFKANTLNKKADEEPDSDLQYVGWFYRNCDDNGIPTQEEINNANRREEYENWIQNKNQENQDNLNKEKMPYYEWFLRHCEIKENKEKANEENKNKELKEEQKRKSIVLLEDLIKCDDVGNKLQKKHSIKNYNNDDFKLTPNDNILRKANTLQTPMITDQKADLIFNSLGLTKPEDKKEAIEVLKQKADDEKNLKMKIQLENLDNLLKQKEKEKSLEKLLENKKDKEKIEKLKNLIKLWDTNINNNEPLENICKDFNNMNLDDQTNTIRLFLEEDPNGLEKASNILINVDDDKKNEILNSLKNYYNDNNNKEMLDKVNALDNLILEKKKNNALNKLLGGEIQKQKDKEDRIIQMVDILGSLDNKTKKEALDYLKNDVNNDTNKKDDLIQLCENPYVRVGIEDVGNIPKIKIDNADALEPIDNQHLDDENCENFIDNNNNLNLFKDDDVGNNINNNVNDNDNNNKLNAMEGIKEEDMYQIVGDLNKEKPKLLGDDEVKEIADNFIDKIFFDNDNKNINNNNENNNIDKNNENIENQPLDEQAKKEEDDQKLNKFAKILDNLDNRDKEKTLNILKENADDQNKQEKYDKLVKRLSQLDEMKTFVKEALKQQEKENEKNEQIDKCADLVLDQLQDANENNNNTQRENESQPQNENEQINKAAEAIKNLDIPGQTKALNIVRKSIQCPQHSKKLSQVIKCVKMANKIKRASLKPKESIVDEMLKEIDGIKLRALPPSAPQEPIKEPDRLSEDKLNEIAECFIDDLFKEKPEPRTRAEIREQKEEMNDKLTRISIVLKDLNKKDQEVALNKLKENADTEQKMENVKKLDNLVKDMGNLKSFLNTEINKNLELQKNQQDIKLQKLDDNDVKEVSENFIQDLFDNSNDKPNINNNENNENKDADNVPTEGPIDETSDNKVNNLNLKLNQAADLINKMQKEDQSKTLKLIKDSDVEDPRKAEKIEVLKKKLSKMELMDNYINKLAQNKLEEEQKEKEEKEKEKENKEQENKEKEGQNEADKPNKIMNEEELLKLTDAFIDDLYNKDNPNNQFINNKSDQYLQEKGQEQKLKEIADLINGLSEEDQKKVLLILTIHADTPEKKETLKKLGKSLNNYDKLKSYIDTINNKKCSIKNDRLLKDIINNYSPRSKNNAVNDQNTNNDKAELSNDKLGDLTHQFINDLFNNPEINKSIKDNKDNPKIDELMEEKLNNVANIIKELNPKDQEKALCVIKEYAKEKNNIETAEKLENLVNNMNNMKNYLKNIMQKNTDKKEDKLDDDELNDLTDSILPELFGEDDDKIRRTTFDNKDINNVNYNNTNNTNNNYNNTSPTPLPEEEKIERLACKISNLEKDDQKKVFENLKAKANNAKKMDILKKLKAAVNAINSLKIIRDAHNKKIEEEEKKKLELENAEKVADLFVDNLFKTGVDDINKEEPSIPEESNKENQLKARPTRRLSIEMFLQDKKKENQIEKVADVLKKLEPERQQKAIDALMSKATNERQKEAVRRVSNLVQNIPPKGKKKLKNFKITLKIIKQTVQEKPCHHLGVLDENEIAQISDCFLQDIFLSEQDTKKENENINTVANLMKELDKQDQERAMIKMKENINNEDEEQKNKIQKLEQKMKALDKSKQLADKFCQDNKEDLNKNNDLNEESVVAMPEFNYKQINDLANNFYDDLFENENNFNYPTDSDNENNNENENKKPLDEDSKLEEIANILDNMPKKDQEQALQIMKECNNTNDEKKKETINKLKDKVDDIRKMKDLRDKITNLKMNKDNEQNKNIENNNNINENDIKENNNNKEVNQMNQDELNKITNGFIEDLFNKEISNDANNNKEIPKIEQYINRKQRESVVQTIADDILKANPKDKEIILSNLEQKAGDDEAKKTNLKSLLDMIKLKEKIKDMKDKINERKNKIKQQEQQEQKGNNEQHLSNLKNDDNNKNENICNDIISKSEDSNKDVELNEDQLANLISKFWDECFVNDEVNEASKNRTDDDILNEDKNIKNMANVIKCLDNSNQQIVFDNLKESINSEVNKEKLTKLIKNVSDLNKIKDLARKVKDKSQTAKAEDEIKKENDLNIQVVDTPNNPTYVTIKQPEKLEEEKLGDLTKAFVDDLFSDNNKKPLNNIEEYQQNKEKNDKIKNIADVIVTLNEQDKAVTLNKLSENANNEKKKSAYNSLVRMVRDSLKIQEKAKEDEIKKITEEAMGKTKEVFFNDNKNNNITNNKDKWTSKKNYYETDYIF